MKRWSPEISYRSTFLIVLILHLFFLCILLFVHHYDAATSFLTQSASDDQTIEFTFQEPNQTPETLREPNIQNEMVAMTAALSNFGIPTAPEQKMDETSEKAYKNTHDIKEESTKDDEEIQETKEQESAIETHSAIVQPAPKKIRKKRRKLPELAQVMRGFLQQHKDFGNDPITILSQLQGIPNEHQKAYSNYVAQLAWHIQNHFGKTDPRSLHFPNVPFSIHVGLALHSSGNLQSIRLLRSTGHGNIVDSNILHAIQRASAHFNPVPKMLQTNPFTTAFVITFNAH